MALNSVANWKVLQNSPFEEIFIHPASGDAGGAFGAAMAANSLALGGEKKFTMKHAYYGQEYSDEETRNFLEENGIEYEYVENENRLVEKIAKEISGGKVVGWFQGKFEWGPRALGSRSILADPRREDMKDIVNTKIKFREPYRPFAPSVLAERAGEIFEMPEAQKHSPARFMLYVVPVRKEKKKVVPAITHVDGSARPQLVFQEESPLYHKLISEFFKLTGVPLVLNTSFNLKGEPIVSAPKDAYSTFQRSGIDILVLGKFIVAKGKND